MNTIKTVVFDLGGVLVDLDIDRCTGAFRSLGMDAVADLINPYYPAEMIGRLEHGIISFHEACDEMRRLSGTPEVTDAQIAWAYGQFLVRIPVAKLRQIDALRERGIRTCVLSNNNPASMKYIRRMFTADGKTMDAPLAAHRHAPRGAYHGRLVRPARTARPVAGTPVHRPRLVEPRVDSPLQDAADVGAASGPQVHDEVSEIGSSSTKKQ